MADLITHVQIPKPSLKITYQHKLFFIGSCFSDTIGGKMKELLFPVCYNPFGVVYNPLSVALSFELLLNKKSFTANDLSFSNELWFSYVHYTLFSHPDQETCLANINSKFAEARKFILQTDLIFITLGTSWVYRLKENGKVVANCHKQHASLFGRSLLSTEQTFEALKHSIESIKDVNPAVKFVFTVSPIRHWKDGAINNQRSKAALILAIAKLQDWHEDIYYFPAYEIFMDELRDYRFYASDMLHPSESAQKYIWEKFTESFISENDLPILRNVEKILTSVNHRPYFPDTIAYHNFKKALLDRIEDLSHTYQFLDFSRFLHKLDNNG